METTDILKLKKPSQNDFYNVNDFNANMDILEAEAAKAKARQATLLVHAPVGYSIEVVHQSCAYVEIFCLCSQSLRTISRKCHAFVFPSKSEYNPAQFKESHAAAHTPKRVCPCCGDSGGLMLY